MNSSINCPLQGVIGVVADSLDEIDLALGHNLQCVEVRADLLLDKGISLGELMQGIGKCRSTGLSCLLTLRHPDQGGRFKGSEEDRIDINRQALQAGADIIDLEWGTEAATQMLSENAPMILSYHDFQSMPDETELSRLTEDMLSGNPLAIKVVPTASSLADAVRMLKWVGEAGGTGSPRRIGFAMGSAGACSRIMTTAFGGPVTYTSFGDPVAPGQIALEELLDRYHVMQLNLSTMLTAVVGEPDAVSRSVSDLNSQYQQRDENMVAIGFATGSIDVLEEHKDVLRIANFQTV